jgi:hypothetical protein
VDGRTVLVDGVRIDVDGGEKARGATFASATGEVPTT